MSSVGCTIDSMVLYIGAERAMTAIGKNWAANCAPRGFIAKRRENE